jgi:GDPmannose 4,6-dehydratase
VIATGTTRSLAYFIERAFAWFGLDWEVHVRFNNELRRPSDISISQGNPSKAAKHLGWEARLDVDAVIEKMCSAIAENS